MQVHSFAAIAGRKWRDLTSIVDAGELPLRGPWISCNWCIRDTWFRVNFAHLNFAHCTLYIGRGRTIATAARVSPPAPTHSLLSGSLIWRNRVRTLNIKISLLENTTHHLAQILLSDNLFTHAIQPSNPTEAKHVLIQVYAPKDTTHHLARYSTSISKCRVLSRIPTYRVPAPIPRSRIQLGSEGRGSPRRNHRRNHHPSGQIQTKTGNCQQRKNNNNKERTRTKSKHLIRVLHGPISRCTRLNSFSTARSVTRSNALDVLQRRL